MAARLSVLGRLALNFRGVCLNPSRIVQSSYIRTSCPFYGDPMRVAMPALSPTMTEGTIVKWYKNEGDEVNPGDVLCDIQTDKAVMSFEFEEEGIIAKILKPDDSKDILIGELIALIVEPGEDWKNVTVPTDVAPPMGEKPPAPSTEPTPAVKSSSVSMLGYGPAVRSLLDIYGLKVGDVPATGPHGRVLKGDVLQLIKNKGLVPAPVAPQPVVVTPVSKPAPKPAAAAQPLAETAEYVDHEITSMRRTIAKRLTESKTTVPHAYATADCNIGKLLQVRKDLIADGVKVSVNDFIIKAAAVALHKTPEVNAIWGGDAARLLDDIDISVAVSTDNGLITPIIKDAIGKGVEDISTTIKDMAGRAREGKLQLHEFQGGSFTISNLGMFGITEFSAVINPPQACILAIGTSRAVIDGESEPQTMMMVTLSSDARVVDDELACRFLDTFKEIMENPMTLLSHGVKPDLSWLFAK